MSEPSPDTLATSRYFEQSFGLAAVKIFPGEYYVSTRPMVLVAVVATCVAVCLRDTLKGIGGVTSFMVPAPVAGRSGDHTRAGWAAMEVLIEHLLKLGAVRKNLRAMVFGGCTGLGEEIKLEHGANSVDFVQEYMMQEGIPIDRQDVLDVFPRKVYYFPATGKVLVRKLRDAQGSGLMQRELRYQKRLTKPRGDSAGEIFGEPEKEPNPG